VGSWAACFQRRSVNENKVRWDGWTGNCDELSITVRGNSFEQAKKQMQADLQLRIESFLPRRKMAA
jgi:hypothetical protein